MDKESVIADMRAVCISRKGPSSLYQLNRDFKEISGYPIPFKQFGFNNLEDFLRNESTFTVTTQGGETFVSVVIKKESKHIIDMIAKQKSPKKRSRCTRPPRALIQPVSHRNSNASPRNYITNVARTSRSAQMYTGKQTFSPIRSRGKFSNYSSVNHYAAQNNTQQMQSQVSRPPPSKPQIQSKPPQPQVKQTQPMSQPQSQTKMKENIVPNSSVSNKEPIIKKPITKTSNEAVRTNETFEKMFQTKHIRMPIAPDNKKQNGANDLPVEHERVKLKNSESSLETPVKKDDLSLRLQNAKLNNNNISNENKRKVINLEAVTKITRNVNISGSNGTENIQVTMSNGTNSNILPKPSAQDRLNRIRQNQNPCANLEPSNVQPSMPRVSQQSRLLKYRNQDPAPASVPTSSPSPASAVSLKESTEKVNSEVKKIESDDNSDNYEQLLFDYCAEKRIREPDLRIFQHKIFQNKKYKTDRPAEVYGCKVKCISKAGEEYSYGSYSDTFDTPEEASRAACKLALEGLSKIYGTLEESFLPITEGRLVPHRLIKIIAGHSNGKFVHQLPGDYREEYRENLPEDWLEYVKMTHLFHVESSVAGSQIISLRQQPSLTDMKDKSGQVDFAELTPLVLPDKETYWNVLITNVCSTIEIWCRIFGQQYDTLYEELTTYMEQELFAKKIRAENVSIGGYYAVCAADSWYRVRVLEIEDDKVACFYIDTGEEDYHLKNEVYTLDLKYRYVPPQAVLLQLSGLEGYAEDKYALKHLIEHLQNKALVAELVPIADQDNEDQTISVILYNTYTNEDVNLNSLLKKLFKDEASGPKLNPNGKITEKVYVSHVCDNGDVYIQIKNHKFDYLLYQIQLLTDVGFSNEMFLNNRKPLPNETYLVAKSDEYKCYRVNVTGSPFGGQVPVFFVDYGFTGFADSSRLVDVKRLSDVIDEYPHQALKVRLAGLESFTPALASRLRGCLPVNGPVLAKVIESKEVPVVEIFMRTQDQLLISVNNTLQNELELEKNAKEIEREATPKRADRLSVMPRASRKKPLPPSPEKKVLNLKSLPEPHIPCDGSYFPITVTMAASPSNFVVQPFKEDNHDFKNLMKDLQLLCKNSPSASPSFDEIEKGNLYAGKHSDGIWYRVQVTNVMRNNSVTVHFCDYGDYDVMSCKNLQKLTAPFLKMPYHAIRARLSGIGSTLADWSVHDCLRFQELVCDKPFIGIVRSIDADELNASDKILSLTLIDTSTEKDVYITPEYLRSNNTQ